MKKTLKTLTLATAFAIASMSAMTPTTDALYGDWGVSCSSGGSNCTIDLGFGWVFVGWLDWFYIEL